jgi:branched-chain amino acid aminotransferase
MVDARRARRQTVSAQTDPRFLWWNGRRMPWAEATVHVTELGWSTVAAVFEGIRAYWNEREGELYVFRLDDHLRRLLDSQKLVRMVPRYSVAELTDAIHDLLRANGYREDCYIRPLAYLGGGDKSFSSALGVETLMFIETKPLASRLLDGAGQRAGVVSWRRIDDTIMPPRVKNISNYRNSQLASTEAQLNGFDTAIILNTAGKVSEGPGACIMFVKDGALITPDANSSILESITRDAVMQLARNVLGLPVIERPVDRTELYLADEIFFVGTWAEITPVVEVDHYPLGDGRVGPITRQLEVAFRDVARGYDGRYDHWRTPIGVAAAAPA